MRKLLDTIKSIPGYDPYATAGDCVFDEKEAGKPTEFFEKYLIHIRGEKARERFTLEPWQEAITANLFGWKRPDGTRRYREALVYVPRKNGKSFLAAGICNYMLFCDPEQGAEIYCAAAERNQARLVFEVARAQVLENEVLKGIAHVSNSVVAIDKAHASLKPISAEAGTKHGFNSHCVVIDELHAQTNRELVDVLITSTGARTQPIILHVTTADYHRESICNEKYEYAKKVRDGIIDDPGFLPVIYEAQKEDDWTSPEVWQTCNPNIGISVSEEYLARECKRAQDSPTYENTFKRLHLNIQTEQDQRWLQMHPWDGCGGPLPEPDELTTTPCYAGLDLASNTDITALVLYWPEYHACLPYFWIPEDGAQKRGERDRVPYVTWARDGYIETTPGNTIDYRYIRKRINELSRQYQIEEIAYDPWNATQLALQLQDEDGMRVIEYRQGFPQLNEPTKYLESLVIERKLKHAENPVLRWMASNVTVREDPSGNIRPDKGRSTEKIDGIVALIMAVGRSIETTEFRSVYDDLESLEL